MAPRPIVANSVNSKQKEVENQADKAQFSYTVKKIPGFVKTDFLALKGNGKAFGSLNAYIIRAVVNQLKHDASL
ncbi:hypothetical protein ACTTZI_004164 [Vibrio vulnificus]